MCLRGRALQCLVLHVHRQGEWTTKSIQLLSHSSSFWISGGDCLGTYKQCMEREWSQSGPLSSPPGAAAHTRYVPSSPVSQRSCHTDLHTSVCVPHLTAIHRKVKDPAHNVLSKTFMYALHVHLHKLFGDTSRSRDQLPSSVWEEMVHCRCCQVIKKTVEQRSLAVNRLFTSLAHWISKHLSHHMSIVCSTYLAATEVHTRSLRHTLAY